MSNHELYVGVSGGQVTISPNDGAVTVDSAGENTIELTFESGTTGWIFCGCRIVPNYDTAEETFTQEVTNPKIEITDDNQNSSGADQRYEYTIWVFQPSTQTTLVADPQIINKPS